MPCHLQSWPIHSAAIHKEHVAPNSLYGKVWTFGDCLRGDCLRDQSAATPRERPTFASWFSRETGKFMQILTASLANRTFSDDKESLVCSPRQLSGRPVPFAFFTCLRELMWSGLMDLADSAPSIFRDCVSEYSGVRSIRLEWDS
jgi:hypothetical protein